MPSDPLFFSFNVYAEALADTIRQGSDRSAFVVGIGGPWGSGKTTLMRRVLSQFPSADFVTVEFNAWAYSRQDAVWRGLFVSVVDGLRRYIWGNYPKETREAPGHDGQSMIGLLDNAERALYEAFTRETRGSVEFDYPAAAKAGVKVALRFVPWGDMFSGLFDPKGLPSHTAAPHKPEKDKEKEYVKDSDIESLWGLFKRKVERQEVHQIESVEQFRRALRDLLNALLLGSEAGKLQRRLIVTIDDVDRCLPEQGLDVFEAIKVFLDVPKAAFLVAMDQDVLQHALDLRYKQEADRPRRISAEVYAEKMIDLMFPMPVYDGNSFTPFFQSLPVGDVLIRQAVVIAQVIPWVPRGWQRLASRMALQKAILDRLSQTFSKWWKVLDFESRWVKMQVISFRWPGFLRAIGSFRNLQTVEEVVEQAKVNSEPFTQFAAKHSISSALVQYSPKAVSLPVEQMAHLSDRLLLMYLSASPSFRTGEGALEEALAQAYILQMPTDTGASKTEISGELPPAHGVDAQNENTSQTT